MKYIYVLEDDPKLQKQIFEALRKSDPQSQIRYFSSFENFKDWITLAIREGKPAISQGGFKLGLDPDPMSQAQADDELVLLVTKDEWLGSRYMKLMKKTHELFIRKALCTQEEPTRVIITAFEKPTFDIKLVEDRIINNVIFKPFDQLILQEHLSMALAGHKPPTQSFVFKAQTKEEVEMTKEVQMEAVGDVGFVTRSPREIKAGSVSKYYGDVFKSRGRTHVMGRCLSCEPHPEFPGEFRVWFSYFGIPSRQISDIRQSMVKRNEIEYSGKSPQLSLVNENKWVLVDPNRERAQRLEKLLKEAFGCSVEHFTGFDQFQFQCNPAGREAQRKEKMWGDLPGIKITFDLRGEKYLKLEPEQALAKKVWGLTWGDLKVKDFSSRLHPISLPLWREAVTHGSMKSQILLLHVEKNFFPVTVKSFKKEKEHLEVEFTEGHLSEKVQWFNQNFPNPGLARGIMIAEEYLKPDKMEFWAEFHKASPQAKVFSLHEKTPDEKHTREMGWMSDIFEESNDPFYVKKKLNWIFGQISHDPSESSTPALNSCQEIIRVANPVEVAELSEAGLIINYYRSISPGSFRQFVLAQNSETFIEYRATCNYSCEHPTEKELFQNHFVLFGISDAHLKGIRLWILESHVHAKQQEGA
ncbi:MAG: hypothetical protein ACK5Y2_01025 [Bdellovibrionales bacterium]